MIQGRLPISFILAKESRVGRVLDRAILRLREAGVLERLYYQYVRRSEAQVPASPFLPLPSSCPFHQDTCMRKFGRSHATPLPLASLAGIFIIVLVGAAIGLAALAAETLHVPWPEGKGAGTVSCSFQVRLMARPSGED